MVKTLRLLSWGQVHAWQGLLAYFLPICEGTVSGGKTVTPSRQKENPTREGTDPPECPRWLVVGRGQGVQAFGWRGRDSVSQLA